MERDEWLRERRLWNEVQMDVLYAPNYDARWGEVSPLHREFVERLVALCPLGARLLDAPCGTGKYWPMLLEHGCAIVGVDQSGGMLRQAAAKFPDVPTASVGLQELDYTAEFDGILCVDAMENVFPEDWPRVLANFHRALKPDGHLYLTVELTRTETLQTAYAAGQRLGLPLVWGEYAHHGGYHYYPALDQVRAWLAAAHLHLLTEKANEDYWHVLCVRG